MAKITEAGLAAMRAELNRTWRVTGWNNVVTRDAVWHFAMGLGDDNPLWWKPEYAASTAVGRMYAPPSFLYTCQGGPVLPGISDPDERGIDSWLPGAVGLWASERWAFHDRVYVGDSVEARSELVGVEEVTGKFAGRSVYQTVKTSFTRGDGSLLAEQFRSTYRTEPSAVNDRRSYADVTPPKYSAEDRKRFRNHYLSESEQRRGSVVRYVEDVSVGDGLPVLLKGPLSITNLVSWALGWGSNYCLANRFGAIVLEDRPAAEVIHPVYGHSDTLESVHWDSDVSQTVGMPRGYDFGSQRIAWISHMLSDWYGDDGDLAELEVRLRRPNFIGDVQWITGTVTGIEVRPGLGLVTCSVESRNQRDEITSTGTAVIRLPSRGGS
jgi:acyl dehydratase